MLQVRLSPLARADLDGIWSFTIARWDESQAQAYLSNLDASMKLLAANPLLGRSIDHVREGYLLFPAASHLLVYRLRPGAVEFMRILHKHMDVGQHL